MYFLTYYKLEQGNLELSTKVTIKSPDLFLKLVFKNGFVFVCSNTGRCSTPTLLPVCSSLSTAQVKIGYNQQGKPTGLGVLSSLPPRLPKRRHQTKLCGTTGFNGLTIQAYCLSENPVRRITKMEDVKPRLGALSEGTPCCYLSSLGAFELRKK